MRTVLISPTPAPVSYAGQTLNKAASDGVVLYCVDGYEGKTLNDLTAQDFDQNAYVETDLKNQGTVSAGDTMYTLVTDENWSLLIPLSGKQAAKLKEPYFCQSQISEGRYDAERRFQYCRDR